MIDDDSILNDRESFNATLFLYMTLRLLGMEEDEVFDLRLNVFYRRIGIGRR